MWCLYKSTPNIFSFCLHLSAGGAAVWTWRLHRRVLVGRPRTSGASSRAGGKRGRSWKSHQAPRGLWEARCRLGRSLCPAGKAHHGASGVALWQTHGTSCTYLISIRSPVRPEPQLDLLTSNVSAWRARDGEEARGGGESPATPHTPPSRRSRRYHRESHTWLCSQVSCSWCCYIAHLRFLEHSFLTCPISQNQSGPDHTKPVRFSEWCAQWQWHITGETRFLQHFTRMPSHLCCGSVLFKVFTFLSQNGFWDIFQQYCCVIEWK